MNNNLRFSIIIPTYNEEEDISRTLTHLVRQDYDDFEIIVIDDSTDSTPDIVKTFADTGVVLVRPEERKGRCEARNIGIKISSGDVLIVLNADVLLPEDFISKISAHYDNGYDAVGVVNSVQNMDNMYARYVGLHSYKKARDGTYDKREALLNNIWWTEAFSVRKNMALKTSLFPEGYLVPIVAGEDVRFVDELRRLGCKGLFDKNIDVKHIAPDNFVDYWRVRKGRGAGTPQIRLFVDGWSKNKVLLAILTKLILRMGKVILLIPGLLYAVRLSRYSTHAQILEVVRMYYCWLIEQVAFSVGEFESFIDIVNKNKRL